LAGADGEEGVSAADDGLVRVVGVDVEAAAGEQLRQDVAGRRDALAGGSADADCEVDVRHGPSGLLRGSSSLRRRPNRTAPVGAVVFVLLHEISHALFDRLRVPILGREEDAADQLAAFMLLRAGEGVARRVLVGAAWMYLHDAAGRMPDETDFSDVHGLDSQR